MNPLVQAMKMMLGEERKLSHFTEMIRAMSEPLKKGLVDTGDYRDRSHKLSLRNDKWRVV